MPRKTTAEKSSGMVMRNLSSLYIVFLVINNVGFAIEKIKLDSFSHRCVYIIKSTHISILDFLFIDNLSNKRENFEK